MRTNPALGPVTSVANSAGRAACFLLLLCCAFVLPACSNTNSQRVESEPSAADQLATVPDDFTLDLRVLMPQTRNGKKTAADSADTKSVQPIRIVLFPGGFLHAETNGVHQATEIPPLVRRLNTRQIAETWSLVRQLGFGSRDAADSYINPRLIDYPAQGARYVLVLRADHNRWMFHRDAEPNADNPALQRLATHLSDLAWLQRDTGPTMTVAPRDYDFGPDPYARYRENKTP